MNKDYLNSKNTKAKRFSLKQTFISLVFLLVVGFTWGQSTITITTTSNFPAWNLSYSNPSSGLIWTAVGPGVNLTTTPTFTPTFNFVPNAANGVITVSTSDTPAAFVGITLFQADNPVGLEITSIDVSDIINLEDLRLTDNLLTTIDVSQNTNLRILNLKRNDLAAIDVSSNTLLEELYLDANTNLAGLDISNNTNLTTLSAAALLNITSLDISNNPELISLNLAFVPLTSVSIDNILNQLDTFGKLNGNLDLQNTTGGVITKNGIQAYINLLNKGWTIKPPQGFDFGDAPDSYSTTILSAGPIHLVDDLHDELRLGSAKDKESDGLVSANADGDDIDNFDDEDGVNPTEFDGILSSTTNISIDVSILNNYNLNSNLHAWLDLDGSGTFDPDEYASLVIAPNTGVGIVTLSWDIAALGADVVGGVTFARFRYTKDSDLNDTSVGGFATGGEVEDYSFVILGDFDKDGIPDITDVDDDNDGILDTVEDNGIVDRDTDGDGVPDRIQLDADNDGCFDVIEAGFTDPDNDGMLGNSPVAVNVDGSVVGHDYTIMPNDLDGNGIYDFQEAGAPASITTQPTDQNFVLNGSATFTAVAVADTYQWEVSTDGGTTWVNVVDDANNAGATTNELTVSNLTEPVSHNLYRLKAEYVSFACDTTPAMSNEVGFILEIILVEIKDVTCNGAGDGSIDITVNGGIAPYTYEWTNNDGDVIATTEDLTDQSGGLYSVKVTDANGTIITGGPYEIKEPPALAISANITHVSVFGGNDGAIDLTVEGGTAPFVYAWSNGAITQDITNLTAGSYTVSVTDANMCSVEATYVVTQESDILITGNIKNVTCNGSRDGAIDISVSGGVAPYTYEWSINNAVIANTEDLINIPGGTYTVRVTDANGATKSETYTVVELPAIVVNANITPVSTVGGNDGAIDLTVTGGSGTYTFTWNNGATTEDISGLTAGNYMVNITDATGCTLTATFTVTGPGSGGIVVTGNITGISCNGGNNGAIDITVTGGTAPYTYVWSNGANTEDISGLTAGNYSVTVRDFNGNTVINTFGLVEPSAIELNVSISNVSTSGGNDGAIDLTVTGGTAPYTYLWSNNATTEDISGLTAGIYEVKVTDKNGCERYASYTVYEPGGIINIITDEITHVTCNGSSNGAIRISVSGGTAPYTYSWSDGTSVIANTEDLTNISGGTYTVTVTDADSNVKTKTFLILESAALAVQANITDVSINGGNDGAIDLIVMGGTAPFVYAWSNGAITQDITNLTAGSYTVSVTDANMCSVEATFVVGVPDPMDLTVEIVNVSCNGLADGSIDLTVIGGLVPHSFVWTTTDGSGLEPTDEDQTGLTAGTYNVTVTDVNGATIEGSYTVTEPDEIIISEVTFTDPTCASSSLNDGSITITATGTDLEYSVDNGVTFQDENIFEGLVGGTYTIVVRVKTSATCSETYSEQITLSEPLCAELEVTKTQTSGPNPVTGLNQTLGYTITLENTGLVDLTDVNAVDILPDGTDGILDGPTGDGGVAGVIEVGETWTYTINYTTKMDDFIKYIPLVNTVIVTVNELLEPVSATATTPIVGTDTDKDGIIDVFDLDDDNDGILDTVEGEGDTNGDGVLDRLSLDADGDGCPDVTEAGFTNNGSDMLGTSNPPTVDSDGLVISANDGYTTPNDLNANGTFDFQEAGSPSEIFTDVVDMEIGLGDDVQFTIDARATYYQWQLSTDNGTTWSDLSNDDKYNGVTTNTLSIIDVRGRLESNLYRVLLTSPDYACDPNPELYSRAGLLSFDGLLIPNAFTPNGDGKNDLFVIPGLAQYPNWSMEIHNRYGSKVYAYSNKGSANPQWWDGYSSGDLNLGSKRVPAGTYFYVINFNGDNRKPVSGWVYITY